MTGENSEFLQMEILSNYFPLIEILAGLSGLLILPCGAVSWEASCRNIPGPPRTCRPAPHSTAVNQRIIAQPKFAQSYVGKVISLTSGSRTGSKFPP